MNRRRRRANPFRLVVLVLLVGAALYVNQVVVPATPPLFIPTPTPTRSPDSFISEALSFAAEGKYRQAIEAYQKAIQADPRNINSYIEAARLQVFSGNYDGAVENAENALLLNPNHSLALAVRGWALGLRGDYQLALASLNSAIEKDPGNALAYAYLAEVLARQQLDGKGDLTTVEKATNASRKALELNPNLMEAYRARGLVLEMTGNSAEAVAAFQQAVSMNDNLADLHLALGRNYKAQDDYVNAIDQFNRAIALSPEDPEPYIETALTYLRTGEYAKAVQYAQQAVQLKPNDPLLYGYLGTIYFRQQDYPNAVKPLRLATRGGLTDEGVQVQGLPLDDTTMYMYARFGISLANTGQCGEALQISQALIQAFPADETNLGNANEIIKICSEQAGGATTLTQTPQATPAP